MNSSDVGKFISKLRKEKSLTQKELAEKLNVTDKAISKWETGKCYPDIEMIEKLSEFFGVSINDILSGKIAEPDKQIFEAEKNIVDVMKRSTMIKRKWQIISAIVCLLAIAATMFGVKNVSNEHQILKSTEAMIDEEEMMRVNIPEVGLKNVFIRQLDDSVMVTQEDVATVCLLADDRYGYDHLFSDNYLALIMNDKMILQDIAKWEEQASLAAEFCLYDFDGDRDQEIVLQETIGMTGGAGQYLSRVFDFRDGEIVEIFTSMENDLNMFDTGFSSTILKDRKLRIDNSLTNYSEIFTLTDRPDEYYNNYWYDENGEPKALELSVDSFYGFEPCDIDNDGVYEIKCSQYTSLYGHSDFVGTAVSILKYNVEELQFEIADSYFLVEQYVQ